MSPYAYMSGFGAIAGRLSTTVVGFGAVALMAALVLEARAPGARHGAAHAPRLSAANPADQPTFRTAVEIVSLNVTVTDREGRFVTALERESFSVFENGVKQEVLFFSGARLPIALALLIDTSASMNEKMGMAQDAAIGFVERMRPDDVMTVIDFDSRAEILQGFTSDRTQLARAIRRTSPGGSTSLYTAVYVALNELRRVRSVAASNPQVRRQALVVLSDGEDTSSLVAFEQVLELAKRSEVAVFTIGLKDRGSRGRADGGFNEGDFALRQFAQETGGRVFFTADTAALPAIYAAVADELAAQYTIGYASKDTTRNGRWRRVVVRVAQPNATARTKQGYYGPAE